MFSTNRSTVAKVSRGVAGGTLAVALLWKQNYKMAAHHRYRARSHINVGMK